MEDRSRILIVDDEAIAREQLAEVLEAPERAIRCAPDGDAAIRWLQDGSVAPDVVITDLVMPGADGMAVLTAALAVDATIRVIVLTGRGSLESAVEALRAGAWHYVTKPYELADMRGIVRSALYAARTLRAGVRATRSDSATNAGLPVGAAGRPRVESGSPAPVEPLGAGVRWATVERAAGLPVDDADAMHPRSETRDPGVGSFEDRRARVSTQGDARDTSDPFVDLASSRHAEVRQLAEIARAVAPSDATIVVQGETGTGKERLVRALHRASLRRNGRFLAVNCGAFPDELLDSMLFGHVRGAFTGAVEAREGVFVAARGGTLFLDEFAEMSAAMQVKLLRVLESREVLPLGATTPVAVDVRLVVASHRRLEHEVHSGRLRADLFYRVNVVTLALPALRERIADLPVLATALLAEHANRLGIAPFGQRGVRLTSAALRRLEQHAWPGNIRELSNVLERALLLLPAGVRELDAASLVFVPAVSKSTEEPNRPDAAATFPTLETNEREAIVAALERTSGHRTRAAALLGIDRVSLWRKMKRYGISD